MTTIAPGTVDDYIASQPAALQSVLRRMRSAIRKALPGADEVVAYKMPTYKVHGRTVLHFAGWKEYVSIYPAGHEVVTAFKNELAPYRITKGTIRFPLTQPIPARLIGRIAKFRANELVEHAKTKTAAASR